MKYTFTKEELYERAFFVLDNQNQGLNLCFEPYEDDSFMLIIFTEDGSPINGHHNDELWDAIYKIIVEFDESRNLDYQIVAL